MEPRGKTTTTFSMRFMCQNCGQPLRLREPPETPEAAQKGGSLSTESSDGGELQASTSRSSPAGVDGEVRTSPMQFTLLGNSVSIRTLSSIQKTIVDMSAILSGRKIVKDPLCEECTDHLLEQLDTQLSQAELDCQAYRHVLKTEVMAEEERKALDTRLQAELRDLELVEARLTEDLEDREEAWAQAAADLRESQAETAELHQRNAQYRKEYCALEWQRLELTDQLISVENQLRHAQGQLHKLSTNNIFDLTFKIWVEGPMGVINNFRLGYLPQVPVSWTEINAALGQTALLLLALANTIGLKFQRYQLVAGGNHSYLKSLTDDSVWLPLFSDGKQNVFLENKFDRAMMAFLDCMQQFKEEAEKRKEGFYLPYSMYPELGTIEDASGSGEWYSIRTHLNTVEEWTKALKFLLVNLKWSLSWASERYSQK
ncbi:beclin-2 [Perognathus longimembris pacificus]|uniref:beclin-2 n=1 Tax=Perognathus longimembris pacificus TaxID=214514 RepID=UPI0020194CE0|nr:beclin-2 [Perognathus longimembris pacificus]